MAWSDVQALASNDCVKLVAVADVDPSRIGELRAAFPGVRVYRDWRVLLEQEAGEIDSVNVSVPDHMHGPIAYSAMQMGKHCYCQKPLAHDVFETRALTRVAREKGVVTQMGIQFHAFKSYRQAVALIRAGVIGRIREVHSWSSKLWGDRGPPPRPSDPVPSGLDWDLWLGVAAGRPYVEGHYHPTQWRRRLDFGTGTLGDMACHILDPVFEALGLSAPLSVKSEGEAPDQWNWPNDSMVRFVFPGTPMTAADQVSVFWYDGAASAPADLRSQVGLPPQRTSEDVRKSVEQGSIFVGTDGMMYLPHPGAPQLSPRRVSPDSRCQRLSRDITGRSGPKRVWWEASPALTLITRGLFRKRFSWVVSRSGFPGARCFGIRLPCVSRVFPKPTILSDGAIAKAGG